MSRRHLNLTNPLLLYFIFILSLWLRLCSVECSTCNYQNFAFLDQSIFSNAFLLIFKLTRELIKQGRMEERRMKCFNRENMPCCWCWSDQLNSNYYPFRSEKTAINYQNYFIILSFFCHSAAAAVQLQKNFCFCFHQFIIHWWLLLKQSVERLEIY